eukprot:2505081-Amphidinium_carterae.3
MPGRDDGFGRAFAAASFAGGGELVVGARARSKVCWRVICSSAPAMVPRQSITCFVCDICALRSSSSCFRIGAKSSAISGRTVGRTGSEPSPAKAGGFWNEGVTGSGAVAAADVDESRKDQGSPSICVMDVGLETNLICFPPYRLHLRRPQKCEQETAASIEDSVCLEQAMEPETTRRYGGTKHVTVATSKQASNGGKQASKVNSGQAIECTASASQVHNMQQHRRKGKGSRERPK